MEQLEQAIQELLKALKQTENLQEKKSIEKQLLELLKLEKIKNGKY